MKLRNEQLIVEKLSKHHNTLSMETTTTTEQTESD